MFKHIASNWTLNALQIVVMLVLSPLLVDDLTKPGYGIWAAIIAATGFIELLAMGVPMASVRHISEAIARKDRAETNRVIATGYAVTLGLGVLGLILGAVLFWPFQQGLVESPKWKNAPAAMLDAAPLAYVITSVRVAASLALRYPLAVFEAHRDFVAKNLILGGGIVFRAVSVVILLQIAPSLIGLAWIFVAEAVLVFLVLRFYINRRFEGIHFSLRFFERSIVRELLGFGAFAAMLNVGTMIAYSLDALVIGSMIGADPITDFELGNKFFRPLSAIIFGIGAVVMPTATALSAAGDNRALEHVFLKWSKVSLSVVLPIGLFLTVLGPRFLATWVAPEYEGLAGTVTRILAPAFVIYLPVRAVALPILLGTSRPQGPALAFLISALMNLALSVTLVKAGYGLVGVALGTAIPQVLYTVYLLVVTCAKLEMSALAWLKYVAGRASLGLLPALALLLWLEHGLDVRGWTELIASGMSMLVVFGLTWMLFVYRSDPYLDLREELALRLGRRRD